MADSTYDVVGAIIQGTPPDENPKDSLVLVGTLVSAYLSLPSRPIYHAAEFWNLTETAGKIWCLLTDVTKTAAYRVSMSAVRKSYRGISTDVDLQHDLRKLLQNLVESGVLNSVQKAVRESVHDRMRLQVRY